MIAFRCPRCGLKLQIADDFAGKQACCPACRAAGTVPTPSVTAPVPESVSGHLSNMAQAGVAGNVVLPTGRAVGRTGPRPPPGGQPSVQKVLAARKPTGERYLIEGEIARGGMGAVLRAVDCDIRREVAVKYMLDPGDARKKMRFVEEAQITGQLEHPNIVPVHELGLDASGRLFFTMKIVHGRSLKDVLDELRARPKQPTATLAELINTLVNVCNAMAYAHSRDVVHRDLKPANIMLGDFGEVYVMDWGLAKVLGREDATAATGIVAGGFGPASRVMLNGRPIEQDQTVEGAVMGTPVYMPPEQASGRVADIDRRSDIYSLGAILYEMLTLQPPVEKQEGYVPTLLHVVNGEIVAPERRAPDRARAGKVPAELSAIAMKALQKERDDRYPSVELLRRDLQLYLEGRSVSAKADTAREAIVKLARRNPAATAVMGLAAAVLIAVLIVSFKINIDARDRAVNAFEDFKRLQKEKDEHARQSVPAFVSAARLLVRQRHVDEALTQVNVALSVEPQHAEALLLRAQLHVARRKFVAAHADLHDYLKLAPQDSGAAELARLCLTRHPDAAPIVVANLLSRLGSPELAEDLLRTADERYAAYRERLKAAWPTLYVKGSGPFVEPLTKDKEGRLSLNLQSHREVVDLTPLQGMTLSQLNIAQTGVTSLTPLVGMPLQGLTATNLAIRDLGPLRDMPLTALGINACAQLSSLAPLRGMKLTVFSMNGVKQISDLSPLQDMPLVYLDLTDCNLTSLAALEGLKLRSLSLSHNAGIRDFGILRPMPLVSLSLTNCRHFRDLRLLEKMPLQSLVLTNCPIEDLAPLKRHKLHALHLTGCTNVSDLAPLAALPLAVLYIDGTSVSDVTPLKGLTLQELTFTPARIKKGLDSLRAMNSLVRVGTSTPDLKPATDFWRKLEDPGTAN